MPNEEAPKKIPIKLSPQQIEEAKRVLAAKKAAAGAAPLSPTPEAPAVPPAPAPEPATASKTPEAKPLPENNLQEVKDSVSQIIDSIIAFLDKYKANREGEGEKIKRIKDLIGDLKETLVASSSLSEMEKTVLNTGLAIQQNLSIRYVNEALHSVSIIISNKLRELGLKRMSFSFRLNQNWTKTESSNHPEIKIDASDAGYAFILDNFGFRHPFTAQALTNKLGYNWDLDLDDLSQQKFIEILDDFVTRGLLERTGKSPNGIYKAVVRVETEPRTPESTQQPEQAVAASDNQEEGQEAIKDPRYPEAVKVVFEAGKASTSILQRRLRLGYGRASRILDAMYMDGIISQLNGSKPREVLLNEQQQKEYLERLGSNEEDEEEHETGRVEKEITEAVCNNGKIIFGDRVVDIYGGSEIYRVVSFEKGPVGIRVTIRTEKSPQHEEVLLSEYLKKIEPKEDVEDEEQEEETDDEEEKEEGETEAEEDMPELSQEDSWYKQALENAFKQGGISIQKILHYLDPAPNEEEAKRILERIIQEGIAERQADNLGIHKILTGKLRQRTILSKLGTKPSHRKETSGKEEIRKRIAANKQTLFETEIKLKILNLKEYIEEMEKI